MTQWWRDPGAVLVAAVGVQYAAVSLVFVCTTRPWLALMYVSYAVGNVAAFMLALGHK